MKPSSTLATLLGAALVFAPCARAAMQQPAVAPGATPGVTVQTGVPYATVNGKELRLDIYQLGTRAAEPMPAVILIHGGGWTSLDKSTMRGMGMFLARFGFVAFSVDYRLMNGNQNRWPAQLDDVQRAVRWVRANASKYGVNSDRIGAFGHSAGGQLAALLGMEDTRDNSDPALARYSSKVQAVVDVSGPTDFTTGHDADGMAFLTELFGASYAKDPEIWREASPALQVSKSDAPFLIVQGTQDLTVPVAQAEELVDKLHAAGVPAQFVKLDDGHTFRTPAARRQLAIDTLAFFNRYLVLQH
jgi:acetyl esterase/lipase